MTAPRTKSNTELLEGYTAAVQASAAPFVDFSRGSILRACGEAIAQVALWLQGLILTLLSATRAATSIGADLDTWMADFDFVRLPATAATGIATFSRKSTTGSATVPVGATVQSFDYSQTFIVTLNTGNPAYSALQGGYVMGPGVGTVAVPVAAQVASAGGNAAVGTVSVINSAITGVDAVTNLIAFTGGADVETDEAFRLRFQLYLASLSRATPAAVRNAATSVTGVTVATVVENLNPDGTAHNGYFYVVVDDGTGSPSPALLAAVTAAVELVRPVGTTFGVFAPGKTVANVVFRVTPAAGFLASAVRNRTQLAVTAYINSLPLGAPLTITRIAQVAYDAYPQGVANVYQITINGGTVDISPANARSVIRAGTVTANS